ncbi:MAG: hypothetical protein EP346_01595 [Bacteroidetes bacterium]|nr:MAG: hypothetical protein EP346_01595 [Bacteroidota bacterium]
MTFTVPYAFGLIILIIGVAFAATFFAYRRSGFDRPYSILLPALRFLSLTFLGVLLLEPIITESTVEEERPLLLWLQDDSQSILASADSTEYTSQYLPWVKSSLSQLKEKYDVAEFNMGSDLSSGEVQFDADKSAIGNALSDALSRAEGRNVAGVILSSDGIVNVGSPLSGIRSPRVPIHTIALGDSSYYPDIQVVKVRANRVAFKGNTTPIYADIETSGLPNAQVEVELLQSGKRIDIQRVPINRGSGNAVFQIQADSIGIHNYEIRAKIDARERNTENNRGFATLEVIENERVIVIVYDAPHPDISALRLPLLADPSYEVQLIRKSALEMENLASADLIVFHRVRPSESDWQRIVEQGQSVVLVTDDSHPYYNWRALSDVFDDFPLMDRASDLHPRSASGFAAFQVEEDWAKELSNFPPLSSEMHGENTGGMWTAALYGNVGRVKTNTPVVAIAELGNQRLGWMNGEGWWRLRSYTYSSFGSTDPYDSFISQYFRWLLTKPGADRLIVEHPSQINTGELLHLFAFPKDAALQPYNGAKLTLKVRKVGGEAFEKEMIPSGLGRYSTELADLQNGTYKYTLTAQLGDETLVKNGEFNVRDLKLEFVDTRARFNELAALSNSSQGQFVTYENRDALIDQLENEVPPTLLHETVKTESLLKLWWPYTILLLLFVAEWVIRKREGVV